MDREADIKSKVILRLQDYFREGRFFVRPVLVTKLDNKRYVKSGVAGQADIYGFVRAKGKTIHVEIEVKTQKGKLSVAQKKWRDMCKTLGVPWILARDPEEACKMLDRLLSE